MTDSNTTPAPARAKNNIGSFHRSLTVQQPSLRQHNDGKTTTSTVYQADRTNISHHIKCNNNKRHNSNSNKMESGHHTVSRFPRSLFLLSVAFLVVYINNKKLYDAVMVQRDRSLSFVKEERIISDRTTRSGRIADVEEEEENAAVVDEPMAEINDKENVSDSDDDGLLPTTTTTTATKGRQWSDVKLVIYMTTHLSKSHLLFLPCWYDAIRRMEIFQYADLILYTSSIPPATILQQLPFRRRRSSSSSSGSNNTAITIRLYNNTGYQSGAVQAMVVPFVNENDLWFDQYDWVIRLNPDVLIRNDTWLIQTMLDPEIDAIVHDCRNRQLYPPVVVRRTQQQQQQQQPLFHTDFTAFRPHAIDRSWLLAQNRTHAETHLTHSLRNIYQSRRFAYVEGAHNSVPGRCRIEGVHSPILHVHELHQFCPYYYNATKDGIY